MISHALNPVWNEKFEFDEIGGAECLKIKCYSADIFGDDNIGSARVNLEGLKAGSLRDVWVPLEKVNTGEVRLQIEAVKSDSSEGSKVCSELLLYLIKGSFVCTDLHLEIGFVCKGYSFSHLFLQIYTCDA